MWLKRIERISYSFIRYNFLPRYAGINSYYKKQWIRSNFDEKKSIHL